MQGGGSSQNNEKCDEVGESHAQVRVDPDPVELFGCLSGSVFERRFTVIVSDLFDFLRGLPEKEIWADRGAQDCDQGCQVVLVEPYAWINGRNNDFAPGHVN